MDGAVLLLGSTPALAALHFLSLGVLRYLVTFTSEPTGLDMTSVEDPSGFRRLRLNARSTIPVSRNEAHEFHPDVSK